MTAQVYQIRDFQPNDTRLRLLRNQVDETARELAVIMKGMGFCTPDTAPCEINPDDCA